MDVLLWLLQQHSTIIRLYRAWRSILLVEKIAVPGEIHRLAASH
jgi:hypothetical protein